MLTAISDSMTFLTSGGKIPGLDIFALFLRFGVILSVFQADSQQLKVTDKPKKSRQKIIESSRTGFESTITLWGPSCGISNVDRTFATSSCGNKSQHQVGRGQKKINSINHEGSAQISMGRHPDNL